MLERKQSQKGSRCHERWYTLCAAVLFFALLPVSAFGQAAGTPGRVRDRRDPDLPGQWR